MISFEFDTIISTIDNYFSALEGFVDYMFMSLNDFISLIGIELTLPTWLGGDLSPIALMLGVSLPLYVVYQFITWVLNVLP